MKSPISDAVNGFGGDGINSTNVWPNEKGRCVANGPFTCLRVNLAYGAPPNNTIKPARRCLERNLLDNGAPKLYLDWEDAVVPLLKLETYAKFSVGMNKDVGKNLGINQGIHGYGHQFIGGEV
jgi:hypothetical protein